MSIPIQKTNSAFSVIKSHLSIMEEEGVFSKALKQFPSSVNPEAFLSAARSHFLTNPERFIEHKRGLVGVIMKAARDGLLLDGKEAAAVAFQGKLSYVPMVQGAIKRLTLQCGINQIIAECVYKEDQFSYFINNDQKAYISHVPNFEGPQEHVVCAYAMAVHENGTTYLAVISKKYIDKVRDCSQSKFNNKSPWSQWYEQMAIKTAIHCLARRIPNAPSHFSDTEEDIEYEPTIIQTVNAQKATHVLQKIEEVIHEEKQVQIQDEEIRDEEIQHQGESNA